MTVLKKSLNYKMIWITDDRNQFEAQYFEVKARFNELLHPVVEHLESKQASPTSSESKKSNQTRRSHTSSSNIKLPVITLPDFDGNTCSWLNFRDTFEALIVNNKSLSDVQSFIILSLL
jgi:hypothetical protein